MTTTLAEKAVLRAAKKQKAEERKKRLARLLSSAKKDYDEEIYRLNKDLLAAARRLSRSDVRFLVDLYYQLQDRRIRVAGQLRSSEGEPNALMSYFFAQDAALESDAGKALLTYAREWTVGQWCMSICGIAGIITSGLLAHLDIRKAPYAGNFFSFAGLSPGVKWEKGQKRPWNADLKCLAAFKAGECLIKVQNNPKDVYGKVYAKEKALLTERNERGEFKARAALELATKKFSEDSDAVEHLRAGRLRPIHIHEWARRVAVKLFLSHLHYAMHLDFHGKPPPNPYVFEHGEGHHHFIEPPHIGIIKKAEGRPLSEMYRDERSVS